MSPPITTSLKFGRAGLAAISDYRRRIPVPTPDQMLLWVVKGLFGDVAGRPVMGRSSSRAGSYQATQCRERVSGGPTDLMQDSRRRRGIRGSGPPLDRALGAWEVAVDLAGDVALEDAHDLAFAASLDGAALDVGAGARV